MPTGIVLGGGGTLGDFQVGVLKYLYKKGVLPHIKCVCGTSIGAINAAMVATGDGCAARLEKYWEKDVNSRVDLIPQHEWSDTLGPLLEAVFRGVVGSWVHAMGRLAFDSEHAFSDVRSAIKDMEKMFELARKQRALYSADLLEQKMWDDPQDLDKALKSDIALRICATDLKTGAYTCFHNKACKIDPEKKKKVAKNTSFATHATSSSRPPVPLRQFRGYFLPPRRTATGISTARPEKSSPSRGQSSARPMRSTPSSVCRVSLRGKTQLWITRPRTGVRAAFSTSAPKTSARIVWTGAARGIVI